MKPLLLIISALLSVSVFQGANVQTEPDAWRALSRSGKGVLIAKLKGEEANVFVFFPATNRSRPTSTLTSAGVILPSLDAAILFVKRRPSVAVVSPADSSSLVDDAKILLTLTEAEVRALTDAARRRETTEPNQAPEPTRKTGPLLLFHSRWPRVAQL